ncbi:PRC-barrel domain-containing protein [Anaerosinus massiliensis]|uniref:PRC-barrel domain-containing protein n=1 Tax=Massilibacillus massiliensis TaxID=1806837 RepID=UPI000B324295|nr:PRC-barrel domain-containing protein [Massilibacillus massiliensis]
MKKSVHILGLPIISITEGKELGISKSLVIDAANGIITALIIEDEDWYRGVKILPYTSVIAIGDDAITITSSESILTVDEATEFEPLLTANIKVIGTKAITKAGSIHGIVNEIIVDDNGKIAKCEIMTPSNEISEVSAEQVSVFGKQVTVIDSEVPERDLSEQIKTVKPAETTVAVEKEQQSVTATTSKVEVKPETPNPIEKVEAPKAEPPKTETKTEEPAADPKVTAAKQPADKIADDRHRRFLLGKKASRRITTDNGIVIVEAGADITEEVLQKAKLANKFVELSMNIQ